MHLYFNDTQVFGLGEDAMNFDPRQAKQPGDLLLGQVAFIIQLGNLDTITTFFEIRFHHIDQKSLLNFCTRIVHLYGYSIIGVRKKSRPIMSEIMNL